MSEVICPDQKVIVLDMDHWPEGLEFACCHAVSHLDWCHTEDQGETFTAEQESIADWVARVRLDIRE